MPIDTAQKRRSVAGVPFLPLGVNVTPDATPGVAWRQEAAWNYSGISPSPPVPVTGRGESAFRDSAFGESAFWRSPFSKSAFMRRKHLV